MAWTFRHRRNRVVGVVGMMIASMCGAVVVVTPAAGSAVPAAVLPPGITKIQHVVVMMQENRSYDSYFARLHYEGQSASPVEPLGGNPNPTGGAAIHPFLATSECTVADLNHSWNGTHQEWSGGSMKGFTAANVDPKDPTGSRTMGYFSRGILAFYYGIATNNYSYGAAAGLFKSVISLVLIWGANKLAHAFGEDGLYRK